jgi:hypothetical protein
MPQMHVNPRDAKALDAKALDVKALAARAPRVLVGRDAKLMSLLERIAPVSYWKFLEPLVRR